MRPSTVHTEKHLWAGKDRQTGFSIKIQIEILPELAQVLILLLHKLVFVLVGIQLIVGALILHDLGFQADVIVLKGIFQMDQHGVVDLIDLPFLQGIFKGDENHAFLLLFRFP